MIVDKKKKNFKSIKDLQNKRIGIWKSGFDEIPKALIAANRINVTWVPILSSINMFIEDGIDAMTVMSYNEYDQIISFLFLTCFTSCFLLFTFYFKKLFTIHY